MISFKKISDLNECERLWRKFSPNKYLFDDWEYRSCFFDPEYHELMFIVGFLDGEEVGVLPLMKIKKQSYFEWFGGEFPEHNSFFMQDKYIQDFMKQLPDDVWLPYLEKRYSEFLDASSEESSFFIDLNKYNRNLDDYFNSFNKKHRKNLRYDLKKLEEKKPVVVRNSLADYDRMSELNQKRFSKDSFFTETDFVDGLKKVMNVAEKRGELEMLSIHIDGKPEAVEVAVLHKGIYYVLLGGNNLEISNIGKLLTIEHIKNAIEKGAEIVDFLAHDCGWKKLWNMEEVVWCEYSKDP
jgi:CelD/BcsL family acetyltransferase involved in cellulose biosynthesis